MAACNPCRQRVIGIGGVQLRRGLVELHRLRIFLLLEEFACGKIEFGRTLPVVAGGRLGVFVCLGNSWSGLSRGCRCRCCRGSLRLRNLCRLGWRCGGGLLRTRLLRARLLRLH